MKNNTKTVTVSLESILLNENNDPHWCLFTSQTQTVSKQLPPVFHSLENQHELGQRPPASDKVNDCCIVNDCDFSLTHTRTHAHTRTRTHARTHTRTHTASPPAFGLVAAASRVTWHLTSWGSGAMVWHPTLQGHVPGSKGERSTFLWVTPELSDCVQPPQCTLTCTCTQLITVAQRESACKYANIKTNTHTHTCPLWPCGPPQASGHWHLLTKVRNLWRGFITMLAPDRCRTRVCVCLCVCVIVTDSLSNLADRFLQPTNRHSSQCQ